jgi:hypothetical protein
MKNTLVRTGALRTVHCLAAVLILLAGLSACSTKHVHKGSGPERLDEFSRVDDTLEEKHLEDAGAPEYIK